MSIRKSRSKTMLAGVSVAALCAAALAVPAIAFGAEAEPDSADAPGVEAVVVTAQKREQALQDVPLAVSAFSEQALDRAQIEDATDLQFSIPNAVLTGNDRFTLRGVGTNALGSTDLGVQSFVNGAAIGYPPQNEFFDLQRLEVLRGPQGTLYGRNTTGGAINVITRTPGPTFGGEANLQLGNFDSVRFGGAVDLPLGDRAGLRLAGYNLRREGYTKNLSTGNNIDGRDQWALRGTAVFEPTDSTKVSVTLGTYREDSSRAREGKRLCKADPVLGCSATQLGFDSPDANTTILQTLARFFTPFPVGGNIYAGAPNPRDLRAVAADTDPTFTLDQNFGILSIDQDFGALTLTFIGAYADSSSEQNTDWDNADLPFRFTTPITYNKDRSTTVTTDRLLTTDSYTSKGRTLTGEVRLASDFDGRFNFLLGAFGLKGQSSGGFEIWHPAIEAYQKALGRPQEAWHVSTLSKNGENQTWALFGESYFTLSDTLRLTLGARYTEEERSGDSRSIVLTGLNPYVHSSYSGGKTTGKAAIDWTPDLAFTDNTLIYGSVSTGYKGGGLNTGNLVNPTFDDETVTAYELGSKNTLLDRRLQANFAAFYYDYSGLQLGQRINGGVTTTNADAKIWGLEGEFVFVPDDHWQFDANLSYLHTEIGRFLSEDAANPAQSSTTTTPSVQVNLEGNELPHAPSGKVKVGGQYETGQFAGEWRAILRVDATWQDSYYAREYNTPTDKIGSWGVLDAQVRFQRDDGRLGVRFFVKNITDEDNITNIIIEDALIGRYRNARLLEPRTFGVILEARF